MSADDLVLAFGATGGFINPRKGGEQLLQALQILSHLLEAPTQARLHLVIFGQESPAPGFSCPIRCTFVGDLTALELASLFAGADLALVPSLQEPLGQVAIEALACGCPVVAAASGGLLDNVLPGLTGWLARPGDPESLAHALAAALSLDPADRIQLGLEGVRHVGATCAPAAVAARLHQAYGLAQDLFEDNQRTKLLPHGVAG